MSDKHIHTMQANLLQRLLTRRQSFRKTLHRLSDHLCKFTHIPKQIFTTMRQRNQIFMVDDPDQKKHKKESLFWSHS